MKTILSLLGLASLLALSPLMAAALPAGTDSSQINKSDESAYRQRVIRAYLPLELLSEQLKVGNYSAFENPTGIFFLQGDDATITLSPEATAQQISLVVHDFGESGRQTRYPLKVGANNIKMSSQGLAYIDYRSEQPQQAPAIKVSIEGGEINGLFGLSDSKEDWVRLLAGAKTDMIDLIGNRVQLVFNVKALRENCPEDGPALLALYDEIIAQQQKLMGWDREGIHPGNHILGRNIWRGFMHADGIGAAFHHDTMRGIGNPKNLRDTSWGVAHEFGHVNQLSPVFCWVGTKEVTNNLYSYWSNYLLNPDNMRIEHEVCATANGTLRGGRLHDYIQSSIIDKRVWQYQVGPDFSNYNDESRSKAEEVKATKHSFDHFVNLGPIWQLQLYMEVALGKKDFYPKVFQSLRKGDADKISHGQQRINFMKAACDASGFNLTRFFVITRMLAPINRWKDDYGSAMLTITPEMIEDFLRHAQQYPAANSSVIQYISANSVDIFKNKQAITPGQQLLPNNGELIVPANQWQGAVAFEVYEGKKKIAISLLGLGHKDNKTTVVFVPKNATSVKAVSWDGKRYVIYQD